MFVDGDQAVAISLLADTILELVGQANMRCFHRWSPNRQVEVLLEVLPEYKTLPEEVQERILCDVVHYTSIGSFSTH